MESDGESIRELNGTKNSPRQSSNSAVGGKLRPGSNGSSKQSRVIPIGDGETSDASPNPKRSGCQSVMPTKEWENQQDPEQPMAARKERRLTSCCRDIADNPKFTVMTTVMTIWALTGDDIRILATNKPADPVFNYVVIVCFAVFLFEIVVSCIGKADYVCSFFFFLDIVATGSMLLDITWVADGLYDTGSDSSEDSASSLRGGRTARLTKFTRVVRVLRLIRIIKLYKAWYEARQKRARLERQMSKASIPGADDGWDDDDQANDDSEDHMESQIGKKMSEMTIRRTILLILSMLAFLPLFEHEDANKASFSAEYGANYVWSTFQDYTTDREQMGIADSSKRKTYEEALLQYVYYHNWFQDDDASSGLSYSHLFMVGVKGGDESTVNKLASWSKIRSATFHEWASTNLKNSPEIRYRYGTVPLAAQDIIKGDWSESCKSSNFHLQGMSVISEEIDDKVSYAVKCPEDLRFQEKVTYVPSRMTKEEYGVNHLAFVFDLRPFVKIEAENGLWTTFFVLILLMFGSLMFSRDSNNLFILPMEHMIDRVLAIRANPMAAIKMSDDEFRAEERAKAQSERGQDRVKSILKDIITLKFLNSKAELMETVVLEKTIIKLGSLLVLGFGQAGCNIIASNLKGGASAGVDAMVPGSQVDSIIGVARVQNFSDTTEVLQAKIMTFVNQIAEIVHGVVNEFHGAPNRNSGDTFLVVWRMDDSEDDQKRTRLADMSVVAFSMILGAIHASPLLADYRDHPGLRNRLGSEYRVNMSMGLHLGWAIEGAVGSEFKIDASYLSPNVSIAQGVQGLASVYNVLLLLSQTVVNHCSKSIASKCRCIDNVIIKGSKTPMELHCVDLDYRSVQVATSEPMTVHWTPRVRFGARQNLESTRSKMASEKFNVAKVFDEDQALNQMRKRYTVEFFQLFNMGYQNYLQGEWQVARRMLSQTEKMLQLLDGPSAALLSFMKESDFEAPSSWRGVRELDKPQSEGRATQCTVTPGAGAAA